MIGIIVALSCESFLLGWCSDPSVGTLGVAVAQSLFGQGGGFGGQFDIISTCVVGFTLLAGR